MKREIEMHFQATTALKSQSIYFLMNEAPSAVHFTVKKYAQNKLEFGACTLGKNQAKVSKV